MSALAQSYFCRNGHLVFEVEHGSLPEKLPESCWACGNIDLYCCMEWGNSDYPCGFYVPKKPIRYELNIHSYKGSTPIYDISKLGKINREKYLKWDI